MHRPRWRTGADHLLVPQALADGEHSFQEVYVTTPCGLMKPPAIIGRSGRSAEERSGAAVGALLAGHTLCTPTDGARCTTPCPQGGVVVRQAVSDLLPTLW